MRRARVVWGAAVLAAVTALASACGGGTGSAEGASSDSKTLTVWHYYSVDGQVEGLKEVADDFAKKNPGVKINYVYVPEDQMKNKLVQSAGSKTGPDVILSNASWNYDLITSGAVQSMDDWWNAYPDKGQFPDAAIQKVDGKVAGVFGYVNLLGLWYNADILKEIGAQPPKTFDELQQTMALAKAKGYDGITTCGSCGDWGGFPWLSMNGLTWEDPQVAPIQKTYQMLADWNAKGYMSPEQSTWDQTVPFQTWSAGKTLYAVNGNWQVQSAKQNAKFNYGVVPLPVGDGKVYLGGEALEVGGFTKNKDLSYKFIQDEFFSKEGELMLMKSLGGVPSRADAAEDANLKDDPILSQYAIAVATQGTSSTIPPADMAKAGDLIGKSWSAATAGTGTPDALAKDLVTGLDPILGK